MTDIIDGILAQFKIIWGRECSGGNYIDHSRKDS